VLTGRLEVRLFDPGSMTEPAVLHLAENQAVLARPGAFQQLINASRFPCRVLYVVGPAYVYGEDYDDAVMAGDDWDALAAQDWRPEGLEPVDVVTTARKEALQQMRAPATSVATDLASPS
jgi:hypothetical protein